MLSSKESKASLLDIDTVGEGVINSLYPKCHSTIRLIISRIDELRFSAYDFHPAEILREDMHRVDDSVLPLRIRVVRTKETIKEIEFDYIVDPRFGSTDVTVGNSSVTLGSCS